MIKKIAKYTGIILLILVVAVTIVTASRQHIQYEAPYPDIKASTNHTVIARGKQLIFGPAHCMDCHSTANSDSLLQLGLDVPLTGGYKFDLPVGQFYTRNITPDKQTGIGRYTDAEIARALRYGVRPDGTAMFDFMPFHNVSDEDLTAIISFLRAQKPVYNQVPDHNLNVLGNIINAFLVKPVGPDGDVPTSVKQDTSATYGKYLAVSVANCNGCHTKRNMFTGAFIGEPFAGGNEFAHGLVSPNLTTDSSSRIYGWSQQDFINRFRMGKVISYTEMPWNSFKRMSDDDLKAIYNYLQTLKPVKAEPEVQLAQK